MTELPSLPALDDHDGPGSLTCAVCSWTDSDGWVAVHDLPTWNRGGEAPAPFALCGFCLRSPSVARWMDVGLDVMPHTLELLVAMNVLREEQAPANPRVEALRQARSMYPDQMTVHEQGRMMRDADHLADWLSRGTVSVRVVES